MTEDFLQYIWQHQLLEGDLVTSGGETLVVEREGELNRDAGPDFINASLLVSGVRWVGNVEVHVRSSDWNTHGHSSDRAYDNVILHVVYEHDTDIPNRSGGSIPTLVLGDCVPQYLWRNYNALMHPVTTDGVPCGGKLGGIPEFIFNAYLERLAVERVERKTETVSRFIAESCGSWELCCYWLMAHYFGGKVNGFAFELLAKATDIRLLARWKDNPQRVEALLMGQAGLLDGLFADEYPRALQSDYEALRAGSGLQPIAGYIWRSFRLRPSSFPTIRISQFANLVSQSSHLFATLLECKEVKKIEDLLNVSAADYWTTHYQFDIESKPSPKRLGKTQADLIIINAWVPLLFQYGRSTGQQQYKEQAMNLLNQLAAEDNRVVRMWVAAGRIPRTAMQSQALLELNDQYCKPRRCLACQIGYRFLKTTNT